MSYQFPGKLISYDSYTATAGGDEEAQYSDYVMKTGMHWAFIPPEEWTARPARKQADPPSGPQTLPENWNIWSDLFLFFSPPSCSFTGLLWLNSK